MHKTWILLVLLFLLAIIQLYQPVCAGISCSKDYFGNTTCVGTGEDSGYFGHGETDYFGNDRYEDNRGNQVDCQTDYFGNYSCN